ncbi:transcriptional regulator [Sciscionella marina]|uniref:transcriptional regulator n=1 Tax=Sciscionella marina TaxID=508770 RepID=UPI00037E3E70|nr:transcriptional regulator [Sciscionella marina]
MSQFGLDPVIHAPKRLAAMALLASAMDTDFAFVRDHLKISDSDLSKQMAELAKAGYVDIRKQGRGPGSSTTYRITKNGRRAYLAHRKALQAILTMDEDTAHQSHP